ncbi:MAG: hypothetical protein M1457_06255, partial [bacterium]|nr:hypothetical protein [bacterium]
MTQHTTNDGAGPTAVQTMPLDGEWHLTGWDPAGRGEHRLAGRVPGHVHADLLRAGLIPDPFRRDQADQCQWVERWFWRYEREFELPADFDARWAVLKFQGLDTHAEIHLNDRTIGHAANMFVPHRFEAGPWLRAGVNRIEVVFVPNYVAMAHKDVARFRSCFSSDRVYARRMQCAYGWDWTHRLVGAGVWRPVTLSFYRSARLADCCIRTVELGADAARLEIECEIERRAGKPLALDLRIEDPDGRVAWATTIEPAGKGGAIGLELARPRLWFPNGYGEQPLYRLTATLRAASTTGGGTGRPLDSRSITFGIRTVGIEEIPDERGGSFTLAVNGERIFARGGNWVPPSPFPGTV